MEQETGEANVTRGEGSSARKVYIFFLRGSGDRSIKVVQKGVGGLKEKQRET